MYPKCPFCSIKLKRYSDRYTNRGTTNLTCKECFYDLRDYFKFLFRNKKF